MWDLKKSEYLNFFAQKGKGDMNEKNICGFFSDVYAKFSGIY